MTYQFFTTLEAAEEFLAQVKLEGYRGYILGLSLNDFEVRYWA